MKKICFIFFLLCGYLFNQELPKEGNIYFEFKGSLNGPAPSIGYAFSDSNNSWEYGVGISSTELLDPEERKDIKFIGGKIRIEFDTSKRESGVRLFPIDFYARYKVFHRNGLFVGGGLSSVFASIRTYSWTVKEKAGYYFYPGVYSEIGFIKRHLRLKDGMMIFLRPSLIYFAGHPLHIKKDAPLIKYDVIYFFGLTIFF